MPETDKKLELLKKSEKYAEFSTMAYQLFANRLQYSVDPFYFKHRNSEWVKKMLKRQANVVIGFENEKNEQIQKMQKEPAKPPKPLIPENLEYISYSDDFHNLDLRKPIFHAGEDYFEPPKFAQDIGRIFYVNKREPEEKYKDHHNPVKTYRDKEKEEDSIDVYMFSGETGGDREHGGLPSPMGYVAYNRKTKEITVAFRGSRSGSPAAGVTGGLYFGAGNPDWLTDMNVADSLEKNKEITGKYGFSEGQVSKGFAATYLSCRPDIVEIFKRIRESDEEFIDPDTKPKHHPKLVITGHSLGGALATMMFIDAKRGQLGEKLKAASKDPKSSQYFVRDLLNDAECFAFSSPPVCDEKTVKELSNQDRYHRVYFPNDPIVTGSTPLRMFKGEGLRESKNFLFNIKTNADVELEKPSNLRRLDYFSPHQLYLVHEQIQKEIHKKLHIKDGKIKRLWYTLQNTKDGMQITHANKDIAPVGIGKERAAVIANQFYNEFEDFLTLAKKSAEDESGLEKTELIKYIEEMGRIFHDINLYESEENFDKFKKNLVKIVERLNGSISNEEPSWKRYPRRVNEVNYKLLIAVIMVPNIALEFVKGVGSWLSKTEKEIKTKIKQLDKELGDSLGKLEENCHQLIKSFSSFCEHIDVVADPEVLQREMALYKKSLSKDFGELNKELNKFKQRAGKLSEEKGEDAKIFERLSTVAQALEDCTTVCKKSVDEVDLERLKDKYWELIVTIFSLKGKLNDLGLEMPDPHKVWFGNIFGSKPSLVNISSGALMKGAGFAFGLQVGFAKFVKSVSDFGYALENLFLSTRTTKNYMRDILGSHLEALKETDFETLKKTAASSPTEELDKVADFDASKALNLRV